MQDLVDTLAPDRPVLIAGPTASGKSALALALAARQGGVVVNADALQVFANWRILTARPSRDVIGVRWTRPSVSSAPPLCLRKLRRLIPLP